MGNPNQLWGQSSVTADGLYLQTDGKNTIQPGGVTRTAQTGDNKAGFFTEQTTGSKVELSVLMLAGVSLAQLQALDNVTLTHACDTGQTYVIRNGFVTDAIQASEGKAKLTIEGPPAEELLS